MLLLLVYFLQLLHKGRYSIPVYLCDAVNSNPIPPPAERMCLSLSAQGMGINTSFKYKEKKRPNEQEHITISRRSESLTLQEKWWWTARLRACFFKATRVAEHFSQHATFLSHLPTAGLAGTAPLHRVPPLNIVVLMRSPTDPGRDM